jgi:hypothetical protein
MLVDNIFDFIKYLDQGTKMKNGVPQDPSISTTTFYEIVSFL